MSTFRFYAEEFRRALNLYSETPDELVEAAREGRLDQELSRWLTPDNENFPEEFLAASGARRIAAIMRRFKPENV